MLLLVTNRRIQGGKYSDEERPNFGYEYQSDYDKGKIWKDGFRDKSKSGFKKALLGELTRLKKENITMTPKVGIYLHGYNNNYHDSINEIYDLEKALTPVIGYPPVIVGFSWPSTGETANYLSDREEARQSVGAFTRFLKDMNDFLIDVESDCFSTTYCIAHSMGNYLLRKGLEYLSDHLGTPVGRMLFSETVMLAPDLASHDIERDGKGQYISDFSRRVHVYYSKHDRALKASSVKRFGGNRLGRHGVTDYANLDGNVVIINANQFANSESVATEGLQDRENEAVSVHSSHRYHPRILKDIAMVMSSVDRDQIPGRKEIMEEDGSGFNNHYELV
jgi:esterase/lipase superfamily enzyme